MKNTKELRKYLLKNFRSRKGTNWDTRFHTQIKIRDLKSAKHLYKYVQKNNVKFYNEREVKRMMRYCIRKDLRVMLYLWRKEQWSGTNIDSNVSSPVSNIYNLKGERHVLIESVKEWDKLNHSFKDRPKDLEILNKK